MIPYTPHPILFSIGPLHIYTYGLFVAIGFLLGIWLAAREAKKTRKLKEKDVYDLGVWLVIGGIIGARLFYVIQFGGNFFKIWEGGLVYYGGLIGAIAAAILFCRKRKLRLLRVTDLLAPYLALGHAIGRIGCFFRGCCYGLPMDRVMPWAVDYLGAARHPTQIYHIIGNLGVFAFLKRMRRYSKKEGFITALYLISYPLVRFIIEFFRAEPRMGPFTTAQIVGIQVFLFGAVLMYWIYRK